MEILLLSERDLNIELHVQTTYLGSGAEMHARGSYLVSANDGLLTVLFAFDGWLQMGSRGTRWGQHGSFDVAHILASKFYGFKEKTLGQFDQLTVGNDDGRGEYPYDPAQWSRHGPNVCTQNSVVEHYHFYASPDPEARRANPLLRLRLFGLSAIVSDDLREDEWTARGHTFGEPPAPLLKPRAFV